jgi:hypothetical protein
LAGRAPGRSPPDQLRLRAGIKAGEISRELDAGKGGRNPKATLPTDGKSKALAAAGISTSTANRLEELARRAAFKLQRYRSLLPGDSSQRKRTERRHRSTMILSELAV